MNRYRCSTVIRDSPEPYGPIELYVAERWAETELEAEKQHRIGHQQRFRDTGGIVTTALIEGEEDDDVEGVTF